MGASTGSPRKPKSNLRQIADQLGVSMMTVSRALNGRGDVAEATRARVLAAAKRLKYRPNRLVHALKTGRSGTVGVMIPVAGSFSARVIHGVHDVLADNRCLPILHFHGNGPQANRDDSELQYLHRLLDQRVDGIIFWPSDETVTQMYLREVWERGVPLVAVDRHLPLTMADFSGTDDHAGGRLVAEHLLSLGHRRLAHIGGEPWVSTYAERRRGFEQALAERSDVSYSVMECKDCECADQARSLLASEAPPTAIFLPSDRMAPHVFTAASTLGLDVGTDVSVAGFAELTETLWLRPKLTTVRQHPYTIGCEAARLLLDRLDGRAPSQKPRSVRVAPELVVGESTGPLPKRSARSRQ